jgi:hypothetical protein
MAKSSGSDVESLVIDREGKLAAAVAGSEVAVWDVATGAKRLAQRIEDAYYESPCVLAGGHAIVGDAKGGLSFVPL